MPTATLQDLARLTALDDTLLGTVIESEGEGDTGVTAFGEERENVAAKKSGNYRWRNLAWLLGLGEVPENVGKTLEKPVRFSVLSAPPHEQTCPRHGDARTLVTAVVSTAAVAGKRGVFRGVGKGSTMGRKMGTKWDSRAGVKIGISPQLVDASYPCGEG